METNTDENVTLETLVANALRTDNLTTEEMVEEQAEFQD
jgi:hypothetical protein